MYIAVRRSMGATTLWLQPRHWMSECESRRGGPPSLDARPSIMSKSEVISIQSKHSVSVTIDRLAALAKSKGLTVFARIDHGQGASDVGLPLRPTQLLIFGNPKAGTPLMQDRQVAGLDLPLRAL